jgi:hypothetical protein
MILLFIILLLILLLPALLLPIWAEAHSLFAIRRRAGYTADRSAESPALALGAQLPVHQVSKSQPRNAGIPNTAHNATLPATTANTDPAMNAVPTNPMVNAQMLGKLVLGRLQSAISSWRRQIVAAAC